MNRIKVLSLFAGALLLGGLAANPAGAVTFDLFEWALNIDGTVSDSLAGDPVPAGVNFAGFDTATGLGTASVTVSGAGAHSVLGFFDIEIDQTLNGFSNEYGATSGSAAAAQSWEIDEPGYVFGDIFANLSSGVLDDSNGVPSGSEDDVSMAMGWAFNLAAGETGIVRFILGQTVPSGFYLSQTDPESQATVYFSGTFEKRGGGGPNVVPEPATLILLGSGLAGLAGWRKRRSRA